MRTDLRFDIDDYDIRVEDKYTPKPFRQITIEEKETIELHIPSDFKEILVELPYIASIKKVTAITGDKKTPLSSPDYPQLRACDLYRISNGKFKLVKENGKCEVYPYCSRDFVFASSKTQDQAIITTAKKGDLFIAPATGVGTVYYLNSNLDKGNLADMIKKELAADGIVVESALVDNENGNVIIESYEEE